MNFQTRPMCCPEPDDVQYDLSLYGCGQLIELNDFWVVFATTMLLMANPPFRRRWRPHVTNCAIVSHRSLLQAVLTAAIPWEACSLMVNAVASHAFRTADGKKSSVFSAFFYTEAFCYLQEAKIISLHFLKDVRCHVLSHSAFVLKWPVPIKRVNAHGHGFCQQANAHGHGFCPS